MNIGITGSSGFVGKNLIEQLSDKHTITRFDRGNSLHFKGIEVLFHLACRANSRQSNDNPYLYTEDNIGIFTKVLTRAIKDKVKRFIYVSSIEASLENNVYAINKMACEKILQIIAPKHGMEWVIIRPNNLYGKYMDIRDTQRNVVANFLRAKKEKKPFPIIGDGRTVYSFTYIKSVMQIFEDSIEYYTNDIVTVKSDTPLSIYQLADITDGITDTWDWVKEQK